eukprot:scaffold74944_cov63-Phaeocystis_antarctica.AAC.1
MHTCTYHTHAHTIHAAATDRRRARAPLRGGGSALERREPAPRWDNVNPKPNPTPILTPNPNPNPNP